MRLAVSVLHQVKRNYPFLYRLGLALVALACALSRAEPEPWQQYVPLARFKAVCVDAAKRVELFQRIWEKNPHAQLYGGSSRDLVWFVRKKLAVAKSQAEADTIIEGLLSRPVDAQEFIVGQSDVDVITSKGLHDIEVDPKFVTRLEAISPLWFEKGHSRFEQEARQGYVPVEKIRLGREGFVSTEGLEQGDGVREIYECRPTFHIDDRITGTDFYQRRENHPVLLGLRYLRQVAIAYYQRYGQEYPDPKKLDALIDPASRKALDALFAAIRHDPASLRPFLDHPQFIRRMNKALGKAFRSYTNPTAAKALFELFQVDKTLALFGNAFEPYHTLMYRKFRNPADLERQRAQIGIPEKAYLSRADAYFSAHGIPADADGTFPTFHGTQDMDNYRNIVFQGNIASEGGSAGAGVYAVDPRSRSFAETWRGPSSYVVKLKIDPGAVVVDINEGAGKRAFEAFVAREHRDWFFDGKPTEPADQDSVSAFADFVGADVVRYPYGETFAYVIKNGSAIRGQEGVTFPLMTIEQVKEDFKRHGYAKQRIEAIFRFDPSLRGYLHYLVEGAPEEARLDIWTNTISNLTGQSKMPVSQILAMLNDEAWERHPERFEKALYSAVYYFLHYNGSDPMGTGLARLFALPRVRGGDFERELFRLVESVQANVPDTYHSLLVDTVVPFPWKRKREMLVFLLGRYQSNTRTLPMDEGKIGEALAALRQVAVTSDIELSLLALAAMERAVDHLHGVGVDGNRDYLRPGSTLGQDRAFVRQTAELARAAWEKGPRKDYPATVRATIQSLLKDFKEKRDDAVRAAIARHVLATKLGDGMEEELELLMKESQYDSPVTSRALLLDVLGPRRQEEKFAPHLNHLLEHWERDGKKIPDDETEREAVGRLLHELTLSESLETRLRAFNVIGKMIHDIQMIRDSKRIEYNGSKLIPDILMADFVRMRLDPDGELEKEQTKTNRYAGESKYLLGIDSLLASALKEKKILESSFFQAFLHSPDPKVRIGAELVMAEQVLSDGTHVAALRQALNDPGTVESKRIRLLRSLLALVAEDPDKEATIRALRETAARADGELRTDAQAALFQYGIREKEIVDVALHQLGDGLINHSDRALHWYNRWKVAEVFFKDFEGPLEPGQLAPILAALKGKGYEPHFDGQRLATVLHLLKLAPDEDAEAKRHLAAAGEHPADVKSLNDFKTCRVLVKKLYAEANGLPPPAPEPGY